MCYLVCYTVRMKIEGQRILISPNSKACQRTKNRIREHGKNGFMVERKHDDETFGIGSKAIGFGLQSWLLRASDGWIGWLPKEEFHLECVGEEFFIEKF